ncbi:hypothetical protein E2562_008007 [Oryza meyeriana var. granulata]|uniref:Uncharacterized protein n=1 Tax=Oryza meyeriana var. granulata TaxID=110450 RepID=A0A6G1DFP5_9ORYZ|nr:hypothetical protein E2562_008007 [Oryza meyeriana var. granulata]
MDVLLPAYPSSPRPSPSPPLLKTPSHNMDGAGSGSGGPLSREGSHPLQLRRLSFCLLRPRAAGVVP